MYKNIVVAYDGSEYSKAALVESLHFAKAHSGKVTMVHAVFSDSEVFSRMPSQIDERMEIGRDLCYKARDLYSREFGLDIDCYVQLGEAHKVVTEKAAEIDADLISIGTHGKRRIKRFIMGSVTSAVIVEASCDVLIIKKPCYECTGTYNSILVPYDESASAKKALERAIELAQPESVTLTLLYVVPVYEEMLNFFKTESIREKILEEARKIVLEGERLARNYGVSANTIVEEGRSVDKILEIAGGLESDLIVIGTHGWRGIDKALLRNKSEKVITYSTIPVLVVR